MGGSSMSIGTGSNKYSPGHSFGGEVSSIKEEVEGSDGKETSVTSNIDTSDLFSSNKSSFSSAVPFYQEHTINLANKIYFKNTNVSSTIDNSSDDRFDSSEISVRIDSTIASDDIVGCNLSSYKQNQLGRLHLEDISTNRSHTPDNSRGGIINKSDSTFTSMNDIQVQPSSSMNTKSIQNSNSCKSNAESLNMYQFRNEVFNNVSCKSSSIINQSAVEGTISSVSNSIISRKYVNKVDAIFIDEFESAAQSTSIDSDSNLCKSSLASFSDSLNDDNKLNMMDVKMLYNQDLACNFVNINRPSFDTSLRTQELSDSYNLYMESALSVLTHKPSIIANNSLINVNSDNSAVSGIHKATSLLSSIDDRYSSTSYSSSGLHANNFNKNTSISNSKFNPSTLSVYSIQINTTIHDKSDSSNYSRDGFSGMCFQEISDSHNVNSVSNMTNDSIPLKNLTSVDLNESSFDNGLSYYSSLEEISCRYYNRIPHTGESLRTQTLSNSYEQGMSVIGSHNSDSVYYNNSENIISHHMYAK
jgi:hypothetical protein